MRIQHNIAALNSYRNYTNNTNSVSKNLEKLSSGYRINRAGDDAAGLAISEKMRAQITGLEVAQKNAQDGISLVQTAEGALTEVHTMLNRMVELADQSANGTYDNAVDRANLQKEVQNLKDEIDRIADGTNFNGINLLDGTMASGKLPTFGGMDGTTKTDIAATAGKGEVKLATGDVEGLAADDKLSTEITFTDANGMSQKVKLELTFKNQKLYTADGKEVGSTAAADRATAAELAKAFGEAAKENSTLTANFDIGVATDKLTFTNKNAGTATKAEVQNVTTSFTAGAGNKAKPATIASTNTAGTDQKVEYDFQNFEVGKVFTVDGKKFAFATVADVAAGKFGSDVNLVVTTKTNPDATDVGNMASVIENALGIQVEHNGQKITFAGTPDSGGLTLQIGDTSASYNQLNVSIDDTHVSSLGIASIDISTQQGAKDAVDQIKNAINKVSDVRGTLGATQNRLEHTINNLSVTTENMTAAESRIRDVDVAKEMMSYTKNNILVQSAQAMLAQANQTPQGVLQLLQ